MLIQEYLSPSLIVRVVVRNSILASRCGGRLAAQGPTLVEELEDLLDDLASIREIIGLCGSFLTVRKDTVYFVHLSVKDFLLEAGFDKVFPAGKEEIHYSIFYRSLHVMSTALRRDIYSLCALDYPINNVKQPEPDPLMTIRYSCLYWITHLSVWNFVPLEDVSSNVSNGGAIIDNFLRTKFLYWLEALSLCRGLSEGVLSIATLEALVRERIGSSSLLELVRDARRFVMYFKQAIEGYPLQTYASALLFSPTRSIIKGRFLHEAPRWIAIKASVMDEWSACLQTLEGHSVWVNSVVFSHDSTRLASASHDNTVKIWDATTGRCLQTLEGYSDSVRSVVFSQDSSRLASASRDKTVKIWDAATGRCLQTLEGHSYWVTSVVFSHDSTRLASASGDKTVKIWDATGGRCLHTLQVDKVLFNMSLDAAGSYLRTEVGLLDIGDLPHSDAMKVTIETQDSQHRGAGMSSDRMWITNNGVKVVWLPSEYRPSCSAVAMDTVGIGVGSGRVWFCSLVPPDSPKSLSLL